jgi:hypothetical protein
MGDFFAGAFFGTASGYRIDSRHCLYICEGHFESCSRLVRWRLKGQKPPGKAGAQFSAWGDQKRTRDSEKAEGS